MLSSSTTSSPVSPLLHSFSPSSPNCHLLSEVTSPYQHDDWWYYITEEGIVGPISREVLAWLGRRKKIIKEVNKRFAIF